MFWTDIIQDTLYSSNLDGTGATEILDLDATFGSADYSPNFITVISDSQTSQTVPEPSNVIALGLVLGFGALSLKRKQKKCTEVLGSDRLLTTSCEQPHRRAKAQLLALQTHAS
ncbi:MAG: PEP-CTERM sorting domain-containing protein [Xenococcaceae cyanobacterium]